MEYESFIKELAKELPEKKELGVVPENMIIYRKGYTAPDDPEQMQFIRETNLYYNQRESDVLLGDYLILHSETDDSIQNMCRFDLNYLYDACSSSGWSFVWKIIKENIAARNKILSNDHFSMLDNYDLIKDYLIIRPINYTDNKYALKSNLYKVIGDIALVVYVIVSDAEGELMTAKIAAILLDVWQQNADDVWRAALLNSYVKDPPRMYLNPMDCMNPPYSKGAFMAINAEMQTLNHADVPLLTTVRQINGAIAIFYPGVQEQISKMIGGSYFVAFTAVDEARIHAVDGITPREILMRIKSINKAFPNEILSRKVYYYDISQGTFEALDL